MTNTLYTLIGCLLAVVVMQEVELRPCYNDGYAASLSLRRLHPQVWVHVSPSNLCLCAGYDWKESGKWNRDCVGVQIVNNWASTFRRKWAIQ